MKKRSLTVLKLSICVLMALLSTSAFAQNSAAVRQYIERYRDIAIAEEIRTGVPASITLAQGIHESSAGKSDLVTRSNNHFGIKCKTEWTGPRVYHDDDARGECFRSYEAPEQSYRDHSDFLKNRSPYRALFQLEPTDYEGWAHGLKKAGYATNPKYPQILIKIIRDYNLQEYTLIALGRKARPDADVASNNSTNSNDAQFASTVSSDATVAPAPAPRYPAGIFRINETPVIHVPKGTSFVALAQQQNVALNFLFEFNDLKPIDVADRDMLIFLQRKKRSGSSDLHVAQEGETLWEVAQREGVRVDALLDYNGLSYNRAFVAGELIALSGRASKPEFVQAPKDAVAATESNDKVGDAAAAYILHKVRPKETLFSLAKKYGVRVEDIQQWNNLPSASLKVGQEVRIKKS
ncbi:MAG: LysM peptidoglycan-binding domain-containing protein [Chitinophagaceae bacterium]|nr:MAG: LysM peptidoglycan-binding domain-containing protein [Chitinophagaceae bacterium]